MKVRRIFAKLEQAYRLPAGWPEGGWPVSGKFHPDRLEVVLGAILTQNTNWKNVEKALDRLADRNLTCAESIDSCRPTELEEAIQPAGYFRQKARYLKEAAGFIRNYPGSFFQNVTRDELLSIRGIGPETADSILLYACERPEFVVDAYTLRVFSRYGWFSETAGYDEMKRFFQKWLPADVPTYKRCHALIVEHAKRVCRKKPRCGECVLRPGCRRQ